MRPPRKVLTSVLKEYLTLPQRTEIAVIFAIFAIAMPIADPRNR